MTKPQIIHRIGVELEGGWEEDVRGRYHDGSVNSNLADYTGEVQSLPLTMAEMEDWLPEHYPDAVDRTCGFHVHISVVNVMFYTMLMNREFVDYLLDRLESWGKRQGIPRNHPFWSRIDGKNEYCKREYNPDTQAYATGKHGQRYSVVNFCYRIHGTLEVRVLPMFSDAGMAISALKVVTRCVESWVTRELKKEALEDLQRVEMEDEPSIKIEEDFACV